MGDTNYIGYRRWRVTLRVAAFAVLGMASAQVLAEPLTVYLYKENGMPVYSNVKPKSGEYSIVRIGGGEARAVEADPAPPAEATISAGEMAADDPLVGWAASCKGVTREMLDQRAAKWQTLVNKHAKAHGVPMPSAAATRESIARMVGRGYDDIDFAVLLKETAADAGLSIQPLDVDVSAGLSG